MSAPRWPLPWDVELRGSGFAVVAADGSTLICPDGPLTHRNPGGPLVDDRPRCAEPGCITLLSRDTIEHGWDLCSTHREEESRRQRDALIENLRRRDEIAAAKRAALEVAPPPTIDELLDDTFDQSAILAAIEETAAKLGVPPRKLIRDRLGRDTAYRYSRYWLGGHGMSLDAARRIVVALGLDPELLVATRPPLQDLTPLPSAPLIAAVEAAAAKVGMVPRTYLRVRVGRSLARQYGKWKKDGDGVRYATLLHVCARLGLDAEAVLRETQELFVAEVRREAA